MSDASHELIALARPPSEASGAEKATSTQLMQSPLKLVESLPSHSLTLASNFSLQRWMQTLTNLRKTLLIPNINIRMENPQNSPN